MIWMNPPKTASTSTPAAPATAAPRAPFRVLLVEADPAARLQLRHALAVHRDFELVAEWGDLADAAGAVAGLAPDLIFCDWDDERAVDFCRSLPEATVLAVMASGERRAAAAFELGAVDFLLKPIAPGRLDSTVQRARQVLRVVRPAFPAHESASATAPVPDRLVLKRDGEYHFVALQEIVRAEAQGDFVKVYTVAGAHLVRTTLARFVERLDPQLFLRVHRSHVINCTFVAKIGLRPEGDYVVTLRVGGTIPVARAQAGAIRRLLV